MKLINVLGHRLGKKTQAFKQRPCSVPLLFLLFYTIPNDISISISSTTNHYIPIHFKKTDKLCKTSICCKSDRTANIVDWHVDNLVIIDIVHHVTRTLYRPEETRLEIYWDDYVCSWRFCWYILLCTLRKGILIQQLTINDRVSWLKLELTNKKYLHFLVNHKI